MKTKYERLEHRFFENNFDITENIKDDVFTIQQTVIKQIVKQDDEYTKQVIKDYVKQKYPNKNVRIDFLNEEVVDEIINLGIKEYQRRYNGK